VGITPAFIVTMMSGWIYDFIVLINAEGSLLSMLLIYVSQFVRKVIIGNGDKIKTHNRSMNMLIAIKYSLSKNDLFFRFSQIISLYEGAAMISQDMHLLSYLSSGERFSIINLLKCPVSRHFFTCKFDWKLTKPNPEFDLADKRFS
jgi:hypothetical protein